MNIWALIELFYVTSHVQNWHTAAILVCSTEFVLIASVSPYEAREALYAEYVVREDKWTTGEVLNHLWKGRSKAEFMAKT